MTVPAWRSAAESGQALRGIEDSTVVVFPTGDHRIHTAPGRLGAGYLDLIGDWTVRRSQARH